MLYRYNYGTCDEENYFTILAFAPYMAVFHLPRNHNFRDIKLKFCIFHNFFTPNWQPNVKTVL